MHVPLTLGSEAAVMLLTTGLLLIYLEFNRPGMILPGALGLTLSLLAASRLARLPMPGLSWGACLLAALFLLASLRFRHGAAFGAASTLLLLYGFGRVPSAGSASRTHWTVTCVCALLLGQGTSLLTTIAVRARQNKGLDL